MYNFFIIIMKKSSHKKLWKMKLDYPVCEAGVISYIGIPTDYILKNRLHLKTDDVFTIREAYARYQDTVRDVLIEAINRQEKLDTIKEKNKI